MVIVDLRRAKGPIIKLLHPASDIVAARDNILLQTLKAKAADKRLPY